MKRFLLFLLIITAISETTEAQLNRYIVRFKNKGGTPYTIANPTAYLSIRAIARRSSYGIPIDSTDLPVTPSYITQVANVPNVTIHNVSKWLNGVTIRTTDAAAITTISGFPFVQSVTAVATRPAGGRTIEKFQTGQAPLLPPQRGMDIAADYFNYGTASLAEVHLHNAEFLHNIGLRGQTMQIAMLDNGFNNYTSPSNDAFDTANATGQVLGTWDFVARESNVSNDGTHGMSCFSTIVANVPGTFIGMAPKAKFWLFQTEDNASEFPIEEFNWVCGAERADSSGANVISSSLGYYDFDDPSLNHTYAQMTGNITMSAIGADLAAKKGMLVFLAAGNEGNLPWHYIITPADADSIVAVGAVDKFGNVGGFSSYGPSADGQIKPDVSSVGVSAIVQYNGAIGFGDGTSYACPKMAGMGTCLWQGFPEFNNMTIIKAIQLSGSRAGNPDDRMGYGIPNMKNAFAGLLVYYATSSSSITGCQVTINWNSKDVDAMKYEIERKAPGELNYTKIGEKLPAAGSVLANNSYQFVNNLTSGSSGIYSYRIRQIIDTSSGGSFMAVYIDTTNINITSACVVTGGTIVDPTKRLVMVQPNPVSTNVVTLVVETPEAIPNMRIMVYDGKGSLMMQSTNSKIAGRKTIDLPISKLGKGKYYVRVFNGDKPVGTAELIRL